MFNKKLKKRIKCLEVELGYSYDGGYYENLESGDLPSLRHKIRALTDYLEIENTGGYEYPSFTKKDIK